MTNLCPEEASLRTIDIPANARERVVSREMLETQMSNNEWIPVTGKEYRMGENERWRTITPARPNFFSCNNGVMTFSDAKGTIWLGLVMGESMEEMATMFHSLGIRQYDPDNNLTNPFSVDITSLEFRDREEQAHLTYIKSLQDTKRKERALLALRPRTVSFSSDSGQDVVAATKLAEDIKEGKD